MVPDSCIGGFYSGLNVINFEVYKDGYRKFQKAYADQAPYYFHVKENEYSGGSTFKMKV